MRRKEEPEEAVIKQHVQVAVTKLEALRPCAPPELNQRASTKSMDEAPIRRPTQTCARCPMKCCTASFHRPHPAPYFGTERKAAVERPDGCSTRIALQLNIAERSLHKRYSVPHQVKAGPVVEEPYCRGAPRRQPHRPHARRTQCEGPRHDHRTARSAFCVVPSLLPSVDLDTSRRAVAPDERRSLFSFRLKDAYLYCGPSSRSPRRAAKATASQAVAATVALAVVGTGAGAVAVFFEPWMKVVLVAIVLTSGITTSKLVIALEILVAPVVTSTSIGRNTITGLHKLSRSLSRSDPTLGDRKLAMPQVCF